MKKFRPKKNQNTFIANLEFESALMRNRGFSSSSSMSLLDPAARSRSSCASRKLRSALCERYGRIFARDPAKFFVACEVIAAFELMIAPTVSCMTECFCAETDLAYVLSVKEFGRVECRTLIKFYDSSFVRSLCVVLWRFEMQNSFCFVFRPVLHF